MLIGTLFSLFTIAFSPIAKAKGEVEKEGFGLKEEKVMELTEHQKEEIQLRLNEFLAGKNQIRINSEKELRNIKIFIGLLATLGIALPAGIELCVMGVPLVLPVSVYAVKEVSRFAFKGIVLGTGGMAIIPALLFDHIVEMGANLISIVTPILMPIILPVSLIVTGTTIATSSLFIGIFGVKYILKKAKLRQDSKMVAFLKAVQSEDGAQINLKKLSKSFKAKPRTMALILKFYQNHMDKIVEIVMKDEGKIKWKVFRSEVIKEYNHHLSI